MHPARYSENSDCMGAANCDLAGFKVPVKGDRCVGKTIHKLLDRYFLQAFRLDLVSVHANRKRSKAYCLIARGL